MGPQRVPHAAGRARLRLEKPDGHGLAGADRASRSASRRHHRARHRDQGRRAARRSRVGLAVGRRLYLRRQRLPIAPKATSARTISRCATPTARTSIASRSSGGCKTWSLPTCASSPRTASMIGAGCAPRPASRCRRPIASRRSAPSPPSSTRTAIATASTLSVPGAASPARTRPCCEQAVKAAGFKVTKKSPLQSHIWRMPARYRRALRRGRRGEHARAIREPRSRPRQGGHARRLPARG